jgi:plastocyanin
MRFPPELSKRQAGSRSRDRALAQLAIVATIASGPGIALVPRSDALAANAHILAYSGTLCGLLNPGTGSQNCWYPANFHVNSGDQVSWSMGSGTHGLQTLNSGSQWPAGCQKSDYPTCSFSQKGTYNFQCKVHGASMSGSVTVDFGPPPPPPSRPGPPSATQATPTAAPNPLPGGTAQALLPSVSPSASPTAGGSKANNRTTSGGAGSSAPLIIGVAVLLAIAGGAAYFVRYR